MSRIISFRGLIGDGEQDTIVLHTTNGSLGYRIIKMQLIPEFPGVSSQESVVKIYKTEQTTIDATVDFSDNRLLAAGYVPHTQSFRQDISTDSVIFDNEIFNQDIYVTHVDVSVGERTNYYIELEQMPLDLNENTVATLKDIRNVA